MKTVLERFGEGAIMTLGDGARRSAGMECISTGSINIDEALGLGGLPLGRIVEVYGPESSGKTTLTLQLIAQAQAKGGDSSEAAGASRWPDEGRLGDLGTAAALPPPAPSAT